MARFGSPALRNILTRVEYTAAYGFVAVAGVVYLLEPTPPILRALGQPSTVVFSLFLIVGGTVCAASNERLVYKYVGLPLLITALGVLGIAFLLDPDPGMRYPRPSGLLFVGVAGMLHVHWLNVRTRRNHLPTPRR